MTSSSNNEASIAGTVDLYHRHLVVCSGHMGWPEEGGFAQTLADAIAVARDSIPEVIRVTTSDQPSRGLGVDVLLFPDGIRFLNLRTSDIPHLLEIFVPGDRQLLLPTHEPIESHTIFVCTHGEQDERCVACGPPLLEAFQRQIQDWKLSDTITVQASSFQDGHANAGDVLIYPPGDWYGYVAVDDIPRIIEKHILTNQTLWNLWRGRIGLTPDEQTGLAYTYV